MNLKGGLDMYRMGKRYAGGEPPRGRKVMFLAKNGYDSELEHAKKLFKYGDTLTVKEIYVGSWSSDVEFEEYPGKKFNTVMFADIDEDGNPYR